MIPYSAKSWQCKTLVNQQNITLAKKLVNHQHCVFRPPDASGGSAVKLWHISANQGANIEKTKPRLPL